VRSERYSEYLAKRTTLSKEQFSLLPGETENVRVSFAPKGLGPETHTLTMGVYDGVERLGTFEIVTVVPGTPIERYAIEMSVESTTTGTLVPVEVTLHNLGTIVGYARLHMDILDGTGASIGSVEYPDLIQVLPADSFSFTLPYTTLLDPGFYTARVTAVFPSETLIDEKTFSVELGDTVRTIALGEDLTFSFASTGRPPRTEYVLTDARGAQRLAGSHFPDQGELVIRTSELPAGVYTLVLTSKGQARTLQVTIRDEEALLRNALAIGVGIIALAGLWSVRGVFFRSYRLFRLRLAVAARERKVNILINRAHRLVDDYAKHAQRREGDRGA
jgi:hypothetical protein